MLRACCLVVCIALTACGRETPHSAGEFAQATSAGDPDGSLTTITGPETVVFDVTSPLKFPRGDAEMVHATLTYDGPRDERTCLFHETYETRFQNVRGPQIALPCDGKQWAKFHVGGVDGGFLAHLHHMSYKGTPVTLIEISSEDVPKSIRVVY